jgi:hypothetical protein
MILGLFSNILSTAEIRRSEGSGRKIIELG